MENSSICLPLAYHQFPDDLFSQSQRRDGSVVLHVVGAVYAFGCLAYLCDNYFVPSLEVLSDKLNLRADVAGATFMAIGSSSPELFTSLIGVFVAKDDVGLGAIVGSAVFNIMFVIGCCVFVTPGYLSLEVWPVVRDATYYSLALIPVAVVTMDMTVDWYDGVLLVLMYLVYIIIMYFNKPLESLFYRLLPGLADTSHIKDLEHVFYDSKDENVKVNCSPLKNGKPHPITIDVKSDDDVKSGDDVALLPTKAVINGTFAEENHNKHYLSVDSGAHSNHVDHVDLHDHEVSYKGEQKSFTRELTLPRVWWKRVIWILGFPVVVVFAFTLPNPTNPKTSFLYPITFVLSLVYIGTLTYTLVWMVTIIGYTIGIPDIIMGLLFLAAGASVPDALASIIVAKDGYGRMSVSNCIGSNVFDILLGLGLPWMIKTLITDYGSEVKIHSYTIHFTIFILMGSVIALLIVFSVSKWRLGRGSGIALVVLYVVFMTISCMFEMNVFGNYNPPSCAS